MPELSRSNKGTLLTGGIYGTIRHPRYIEALFWSVAYALFANYVGAYVAVGLCIPVLYLIVVLEERELRGRFGAEYVAYCSRVPRFIPRRDAPS
jgi:protein-S-isoprenylcysteine O-methyltransferase Ste14